MVSESPARSNRLRHRLSVLVLLAGLLLSLGAAPSASAAGAAPLNLSDPAAVAAFLDPYVAKSMTAAHVPGAAVIVVKDGRVLYAHGYGYSDLARRSPVDPQTTLFRVASVSKLLTTTAVLRLADRGQVQLDADVNQYLAGVRVPATYPRPVTLAQLLTHTAGFEELNIDHATLSAVDQQSLASYLSRRMPRRVTAPGAFYSYSNYGFALAGYAVQSVAGQPFEQYLANQIFQPLGMDHSTFAQPLPAPLAGSLATGYDVVGSTVTPAPFEYFNDAPADALSTTAADMARFMIFQLRDAPGDDVLSAPALAEMQALHFQSSPAADFNGMAYGFQRYERNEQLILSKEGDVRGFSSYLSLMPDQHFGFFIAANTVNSGWMQDLERQLVNRAFPPPAVAPPVTPPSLGGSLVGFTGTYEPSRASQSTIEKLSLATQQIRITDAGNGALLVAYPNGASNRLMRVAPLQFANQFDGVTYHWAFLTDAHGQVAHFLMGNDVYNRIAWYQTSAAQFGFGLALVALFLIGFAWCLLPALARRSRRLAAAEPGGQPCPLRPSHLRLANLARPIGGVICGSNLLFVLALVAILTSATATQNLDYSWVTYGTPRILYVVLCLPLIALALTLALPASAIVAGRAHAWSRAQYGYCALVILAELAFIPFLLYWNLLGFHV